MTSIETKCSILSDLWINYKGDEGFADFIEYNDIGLPLAYLLNAGLVKPEGELPHGFINETFDLLLAALDLEEDTGFDDLDQLLNSID